MMGGAGFGQGLAQGLQQAQDRQMQFAELKLRQDHAKALQKSMEAEDQMKQLQLQSLQRKMAAQEKIPGMQQKLLEPMTEQDQRAHVASLLQQAEMAGMDSDKLLNYMILQDPTGKIKQYRESLRPSELREIDPTKTLAQIDFGGSPTEAAPPVTANRRQQVRDPDAGQPDPRSIFTGNYQMGPDESGWEPKGPIQDLNPAATAAATPAASVQSGPRITPLITGTGKRNSVEESKVVADLAGMFPEKMATLQQELGHPPNFNDVGQFFTPQEFAQSFLAKEERVRKGQVEVAQQTGVAAADRAFELAQKKEKIPQKPSAGERKDFAEDQSALEQARGIIDKFDPKFVGPYQGRYGNIKEMIGNLGYDEAEFRGVVARTRNATIKAITGAQMGEKEADRIRQELPEFNLSPEAFIARMRLTYANLYDMARIRRKIAGETGIDIAGLSPLVPPEEINPQIRQALRQAGGLTPAGKAQERTTQGQKQTEDREFLKALPKDMQPRYQSLSPSDKAKFRERYQQKLQALPQGAR